MELGSRVLPSSHTLSEGVACVRPSSTHGVTSSYGAFISEFSACRRVPCGDQMLERVKSPSCRSSGFNRRSRCLVDMKPLRVSRLGQVFREGSWTQGALPPGGRSSNFDNKLYLRVASFKWTVCLHRKYCRQIERSKLTTGYRRGSLRLSSSIGWYGVDNCEGSPKIAKEGFQAGKGLFPTGPCSDYLRGAVVCSGRSREKKRWSLGFRGPSRTWNGVALGTKARWMTIGRFSIENQTNRNGGGLSATKSDSALSSTSPSSNASNRSYLVKDGDTLTSIAKSSKTSVQVLADVNRIKDVDFLLAGQLLLIPSESETYERLTRHPLDVDEFPIPRAFDLGDPSRKGVSQQVDFPAVSGGRASSSRSVSQQVESHQLATTIRPASALNFPKLAVAVLLVAPLLGYFIRCIIDALYIHMAREEAKHQADREAWEMLHRPKAKRWQKILEEDRDGIEYAPSSTDESATRNSWAGGDVWSPDANWDKPRESTKNETEEEIGLRHKQDYEEIRKSYAELESSYIKFLSDSGMSKSGYWRGSGVPTSARLDDGEAR